MGKTYKYITGFFIAFVVIGLCFYIVYTIQSNQSKHGNDNKQLVEDNAADRSLQDGEIERQQENQNLECISQNAIITEEVYDINSSTCTSKKIEVPKEYVGMTKEKLVETLKKYSESIPAAEVAKGFISMNVMSFSGDSIVIRKLYNSNSKNCKYFLTEENGRLVIYDKNKSTIVDKTDILFEHLTQEQQEKIKKGVYVESVDELYGLLESFSS